MAKDTGHGSFPLRAPSQLPPTVSMSSRQAHFLTAWRKEPWPSFTPAFEGKRQRLLESQEYQRIQLWKLGNLYSLILEFLLNIRILKCKILESRSLTARKQCRQVSKYCLSTPCTTLRSTNWSPDHHQWPKASGAEVGMPQVEGGPGTRPGG